MSHRFLLPATLTCAALLTACGGTDIVGGDLGGGDMGGGDDATRLSIVASSYPLQFATWRVLGSDLSAGVTVSSLVSPGADAHDLELTPRQVGRITNADLVVYASGMQPTVDAAVNAQAADHSVDVTPVVDLVAHGAHAGGEHADEHEGESDGEHADEHSDEGHDEHSDDGHNEHSDDGHDHSGGLDPHFWLDPERYAKAGEAIAEQLAVVDPVNAEAYRANAQAFTAELDQLDQEFATALSSCAHDTVVTTHEAFGYLTERYGLHQIGITGITPEAEASPARMAEITQEVASLGVPTIYAEASLDGSDLADVIAQETGTRVLVLETLESPTGGTQANGYFEHMEANLTALKEGQECS